MALSLIGLLNEIDTQLASNSTGQVSATKLRPVLKDIVGPRLDFTLSAPPTAFASTDNLSTAFNGDLRNVRLATSYNISGANTLGHPATGYLMHPETSPFYTYVASASGWNNNVGDNNGRTGTSVHFTKIDNYGMGDLGGYFVSGIVVGSKPGATHWLAGSAIGAFGCDLYAAVNGAYLNPMEIDCTDLGFDASAIGCVYNMSRSNATSALHQLWAGTWVNSIGTQPVDYAHFASGSFKTGIYMPGATFTLGAAIVTGPNTNWYMNAAAPDTNTPVAALGDTWMGYSSGLGGFAIVVGNTASLEVFAGVVVVPGVLSVLGNTVFNPPASATPVNNGELVLQRTSNTSLAFKLKGTDGTVRSASLTLA